MKGLLGRVDTRAQIALLAVLAAYFMAWPLWRAGFPIEIAQNEGWNAYHADAAMGAAPLYPPTDTLIINTAMIRLARSAGYVVRASRTDASLARLAKVLPNSPVSCTTTTEPKAA